MKCKSQNLGSSLFCFLFFIWNALCKFIQKFDVYLKRFLLIFENLKPSILNFTCKFFLSFFCVEKFLQVCMPYPVRLDILTLKCSKLSMDRPVIVNYNTIMAGGCRRFCSNFCKNKLIYHHWILFLEMFMNTNTRGVLNGSPDKISFF